MMVRFDLIDWRNLLFFIFLPASLGLVYFSGFSLFSVVLFFLLAFFSYFAIGVERGLYIYSYWAFIGLIFLLFREFYLFSFYPQALSLIALFLVGLLVFLGIHRFYWNNRVFLRSIFLFFLFLLLFSYFFLAFSSFWHFFLVFLALFFLFSEELLFFGIKRGLRERMGSWFFALVGAEVALILSFFSIFFFYGALIMSLFLFFLRDFLVLYLAGDEFSLQGFIRKALFFGGFLILVFVLNSVVF